jgi:hypothetical protein
MTYKIAKIRVLCFYVHFMSELRVKIRYGDHEFELEGAADAVERQLEAFRLFLSPPPPPLEKETKTEESDVKKAPPRVALEKIMRVRGPIYSLSFAAKVDEATLIILLGQRTFRQNDNVSGTEIMEGLRESGIRVRRVDTVLTKHIRTGIVVAMGRHRRRRYRLSMEGIEQAQQIARALIAKIPPPNAPSAENPMPKTAESSA